MEGFKKSLICYLIKDRAKEFSIIKDVPKTS